MKRVLLAALLCACGRVDDVETQEFEQTECASAVLRDFPYEDLYTGQNNGTLRLSFHNYYFVDKSCSDIRTGSRWRRAMECAWQNLDCIEELNPTVARRVRASMTRGSGKKPLNIGCAIKDPACAGVHVATSVPKGVFASERYPQYQGLNEDSILRATDAQLCQYALHEVMHWAGFPGAPAHNDTGFPQDDEVYACGRYCGGCITGPSTTHMADCNKCADGPERKGNYCGMKIEVFKAPGPGDCDMGRWGKFLTCEQEPARVPSFLDLPGGPGIPHCCETERWGCEGALQVGVYPCNNDEPPRCQPRGGPIEPPR